MTVVDDWVGDDEVLPARTPRAAQPVLTPPTSPPPEEKPAKTRKTARPLAARGTIALGGLALAGTGVTVAAAAGGMVAAAATGGGFVLIPYAVWRATRSRTGQRAARRRARPARTRRTRATGSWLPGGLGGGGQHRAGLPRLTGTGRPGGGAGRAAGAGRRAATGAAGGRTGGARSGAIPRPRMPRLGTGRSTGTGRAGAMPRLRTPRAATGSGRVRGLGGGMPRIGRTGRGHGGGRLGSLGTGARLRGLGGGGAGIHGGRLPTRRMVRRAIRHGHLPPSSVRPSRIARLGTGANRQGYQVGAAVRRGVQQPTTRAAAQRAYRRYVRQAGRPTTMTGVARRVIGGAIAGASAGGLRLGWNGARKAGRALRAYYLANTQQPATPAGVPPTGAPHRPAPSVNPAPRQHPVPPPAFAPPAIPVTPPAPTTRPVPAGVSAGTTPGGNTMSVAFPAHSHAADFFAACAQFQPTGDNGYGSIWKLQDSLPWAAQAIALIANGWAAYVSNCEASLTGGLHPGMKQALGEVYRPLVAASHNAAGLEKTFVKMYAADIERANTVGGHTRNVPV